MKFAKLCNIRLVANSGIADFAITVLLIATDGPKEKRSLFDLKS